MPVESIRPTSEQPKTDQSPTSPEAVDILRSAQYALRWNPSEVAGALISANQERIKQLKKQARKGSLREQAETRHVVTKAREQVSNLRQLGLASGPSEGMLLAVPITTEGPGGEPIRIHDSTKFELWYLSRTAIEKAMDSSYRDQATKPVIDRYVYRAALGFIVDDERKTTTANQVVRIDLNPLATSELVETAKYMKDNKLHREIPSARDILTREILFSGQFPSTDRNIEPNIVPFSIPTRPSRQQAKRTA